MGVSLSGAVMRFRVSIEKTSHAVHLLGDPVDVVVPM